MKNNLKWFCLFGFAAACMIAGVEGTSASYITQTTSSDSARVASFNAALNTDNTGNMNPTWNGETQLEYPIEIDLNSEVATEYQVVVENVPNEITVRLADGTADSNPQPTDPSNASLKTHVLSVGGTRHLEPNAQKITNKVIFELKSDVDSTVDQSWNKKMKVKVVVKQYNDKTGKAEKESAKKEN